MKYCYDVDLYDLQESIFNATGKRMQMIDIYDHALRLIIRMLNGEIE